MLSFTRRFWRGVLRQRRRSFSVEWLPLQRVTMTTLSEAHPALAPALCHDEDPESKNSRKRKFGMPSIAMAGLGGAVTTWLTYEQLKTQSEQLQQEMGMEEADFVRTRRSVIGLGKVLQAAQSFVPPPEQPLLNEPSRVRIPPAAGGGGSRRDRFNFIAEVVEETAPALVYIEIKDPTMIDYYSGQPATKSNGSGFIVRQDGLILTNAHVVVNEPRASVHVRLQDGRSYIGKVEDVDVRSDLATVRIPVKGLATMKLGKSSDIRPGEFVIAMGSPLSLSNTITTGVVSSVARNRRELGLRGRDIPDYIQTDAAITFGNSGGPLINLDGEAIGINSIKLTPGISFAIPIDYAKEFLQKSEESRLYGKPRNVQQKRYLGITMVALNSQILDELRSKRQTPAHVSHGIFVYRVVQGSPADRAGIQPGDIITHINDTKIFSSSDIYSSLQTHEKLNLNVVRNNQDMTLAVAPAP